jgi:hypothetical protein
MRALPELVVVLSLSVSCGVGVRGAPTTVPGPEATELVARTNGAVLVTRPIGGIESIRLPGLESANPRAPNSGLLPVHSLAGPDARGRIAFVENDMLGKRHALKMLPASGETETVFEASGDALWDHAVGEHLALDPSGRFVALVVRLKPVQNRSPDALFQEGRLEIWSVDERRLVDASVLAIDDTLSWFPDGKRLVYAGFVDRVEAAELLRTNVPPGDAFGQLTNGWTRVPVVHELDLSTGRSKALRVGERPLVSPDGALVLLRDFELRWRTLDLATNVSRAFEAPGAIFPGAIAFVDPNTVLFWAWPTEGAHLRFTSHNSPLVGAKQMRALKLVDLRNGRFQTVAPAIDPRYAVAFGL